jgi:hypothetical protein
MSAKCMDTKSKVPHDQPLPAGSVAPVHMLTLTEQIVFLERSLCGMEFEKRKGSKAVVVFVVNAFISCLEDNLLYTKPIRLSG